MTLIGAYNLNTLRSHPLILLNKGTLFCPIPPLILRRLTEGLYFDLVTHADRFSQGFGAAYQDFVGQALAKANHGGVFTVLGEERYGTRGQPKDSVDWIVTDRTGTLFVECKASRMRLRGRIDLTSFSAIQVELERLADFVIQVYLTLNDALGGAYRRWKPNGLPVYPIVCTLDDWQAFGAPIQETIDRRLAPIVASGRLAELFVREHPYTICSIREFELAIQVMARTGIAPVMSHKTNEEHQHWAMHAFLSRRFEHEIRAHAVDLFAAEYDAIGALRRP